MTVTVHHGDSREVIRTLADASVDSVVTDPPYALVSITKRFGKTAISDNTDTSDRVRSGADGYARLSKGFMGSVWDNGSTAFDPAFWAEVLRVLKPGGHVLAFGGTRTYHRLAVAIEDAGFEIRDAILWHYGSGFPKSHDVGKNLDKASARCTCGKTLHGLPSSVDSADAISGDAQPDLQQGVREQAGGRGQRRAEGDTDHPVRDVRGDDPSGAIEAEKESVGVLQQQLSQQDIRRATAAHGCERPGQETAGQGASRRQEPSLEGRRDVSQAPRELRLGEVCALPAGAAADGASGRLRDGASPSNGEVDRPAATARRGRASRGSQAAEQSAQQFGTVAGQSEPQAGGAWPRCDRCGKPIVPDGLGTALKPACEIICVARKPLIGTVAANVLQHGTGALNIDACRVEFAGTEDAAAAAAAAVGFADSRARGASKQSNSIGKESRDGTNTYDPFALKGRWPANVVHDGSDEVVSGFPEGSYNKAGVFGRDQNAGAMGGKGFGSDGDKTRDVFGFGDSGSAARFFYTAKADAADRLGSKHPTVKPVDLMRWLVRLVTPPGGLVLDPFAGSGTTGMACLAEGFNAVLIEREEQYYRDILRRLDHVQGADTPLFCAAASSSELHPAMVPPLCGSDDIKKSGSQDG